MVLYTGLWNPSNYQNKEDAEHQERQSLRRQQEHAHEHEHEHGRRQMQQQTPPNSARFVLPRTIEYGSIVADQEERQQQLIMTNDSSVDNNNDKTVTWEDDSFSKNDQTNHQPQHAEDATNGADSFSVYTGGGGSSSTGTSSSLSGEEQALPSLTAAFQNLENRPIIINCLWYLVIYFTIAVMAYSFVLEQWTIVDSLYFAVATFTTCGYGDLEPTTVNGQLFTIFFAIYGVIILGVFIAIFGSFISEYQSKTMKRFQRKKQHQMIETLFTKRNNEDDDNDNDNDNGGRHTKNLKEKKEEKEEEDQPAIEDSGFWRDHVSLADDVWRVLKAESPLIALVAGMALVLGIREGWGVTSTLYFCIMAATTTGYGDYTPTNQLDKLYCVLLLPLAVAVFGEVLGRIATVYIQRKQRDAQFKFLHRSLTLCDIRNMDSNEDGKVDREDFLIFMLVALQKVDRATIDELRAVFDSLDSNGNGLLEEDDLVELAEENYLPTVERIRKEYSRAELDEMLLRELPKDPVVSPDIAERKHRRVHTVL